jgi:hypothetical protein
MAKNHCKGRQMLLLFTIAGDGVRAVREGKEAEL